MATPRKRWFRVATSILREPWDNDTLAFSVRLMAWLQDRWARDGLGPEDGCRALIGPGQLCAIAGCQSIVRARSIARRLAADTSCTVDARGADTLVQWRKYADFQELRARVCPENAPSVSSASASASDKKKNTLEDSREGLAPLDTGRLVRLLGKEPGSSEGKLAWLESELPIISLMASEDHPSDLVRQMAAVRSRVLRHYRQHQRPKGGEEPLTGARIVRMIELAEQRKKERHGNA